MLERVLGGQHSSMASRLGSLSKNTLTLFLRHDIHAPCTLSDGSLAVSGFCNWIGRSCFAFSKKGEDFRPPPQAITDLGGSYEPSAHGYHGPLTTCISPHILAGDIHNVFNTTFQKLGIPPRYEFNGGDLRGFGIQQATQDPYRGCERGCSSCLRKSLPTSGHSVTKEAYREMATFH